MRSLGYYIKNPLKALGAIVVRCNFFFPDDELYLKLLFRLYMGKRLNLKRPQTYSEKLQWLKLHDRKPEYTQMVDKITAKEYVASIIGRDYIIPTLGIWKSFDEIDFSTLPDQFVLKTNNGGGGGGIAICKNKATFNKKNAEKKLMRSMKSNLYRTLREWPYKNIKSKILAEQFMQDDSGQLRDYKFFCFSGVVRAVLVATNRFTSHNFNYYDPLFNPLPIESRDGKCSSAIINRPEKWDEMISIAEKLSKEIPFIRVDLYYVNNHVYFGELTFFDSSGYDDLSSEHRNMVFGDWIQLPDCN